MLRVVGLVVAALVMVVAAGAEALAPECAVRRTCALVDMGAPPVDGSAT